jgi:uncharacterized membrane protein YkvA (DUF1232 family)
MIAGWLSVSGWMVRTLGYRLVVELLILAQCVLLSFSCLWSKLVLALGIAYSFGPIDLIPDRIPYYGHLDEAGFIIAGLIIARLLVPAGQVVSVRARHPAPSALPRFTIVFCHCPKTAGTSLFRALTDRLGYRHSYLMRRTRPDLRLLRRRGFALVSGHAPYGHYLASGAVDGATRFITFFREPRAVLLSHFAHVLRHRHEIPAAKTFFEEELPRQGLAMTSPEAVRLFIARFRDFDGWDADNPQVRFATNRMRGPLDATHLDQAKATFAAMDLVGCTERFDESLMLLADRFGWPSLDYHRLNVSADRQRAAEAPALLAELDRHLVLDHALIGWARSRFDAQLAATRAGFAADGMTEPSVTLLQAEPPYRAFRHRLAAASTLLWDDWLWWLGTRRALLGRRLARQRNRPSVTKQA